MTVAGAVVLTGASSFTGTWFAMQLRDRGWPVVAPLGRSAAEYEPLRAHRVARLQRAGVEVVPDSPVGSDRFRRLLADVADLTVLCVHHAAVGDYNSLDYDVAAGVDRGAGGARGVLDVAQRQGLQAVVVTRSVFESGQGISDDPRPIGLYGVAKRAVSDAWLLQARSLGLTTAEFTITNPYGPLEEPRFVNYLVARWSQGEPAVLRSPQYVRDNVEIPRLATRYVETVAAATGANVVTCPSGMIETNLEYARRIADRFGPATGWDCEIRSAVALDDDQPRLRVGREPLAALAPGPEAAFWSEYLEFYLGDRKWESTR